MSELILITGGARSGKSAFAVSLARRSELPVMFLATCVPGADAEMQARVAAHRAQRPPGWRLREEGYALASVLDAARGDVRIAWGRSENAGRGAGLPTRSRPVAGEKCPALEPDRPSSGGGDEGGPTKGRRGGAAPESLRRAAAPGPMVVLDCIPTWLGNLLVRGDSDSEIEEACGQLVEAIQRCPARLVLAVTAEVGAGLVPETPLGRRFRDSVGIANQLLAAIAARVYLLTAGLAVELKQPAVGVESIAAEIRRTLV